MKRQRWKTKSEPHQIGKFDFTIKDCPMDCDGWVKESFARPLLYDLVWGKGEGKAIPVWWTGIKWEGLRLKSGDKILFWKEREGWEQIC